MKGRISDVSLCFSVWILCSAVTGGWVWSSGPCSLARSHRYNGVTGLLCLDGFLFTTPGVSASQQRGSSWPRDIVLEKESRKQSAVYSSLVRALQSVYSATALVSLSCTGRYGWCSRQWVGAAMGGLVFFRPPPPNYRWVNSPYWLDFISVGCRCGLVFQLVRKQRSCGKGVAWIIGEERTAPFIYKKKERLIMFFFLEMSSVLLAMKYTHPY